MPLQWTCNGYLVDDINTLKPLSGYVVDTYRLVSGSSLLRQWLCSVFIIVWKLRRRLHTNVQEDRMTTKNKEEQPIKPGYIDLLNNPDYYHHIKDAKKT